MYVKSVSNLYVCVYVVLRVSELLRVFVFGGSLSSEI